MRKSSSRRAKHHASSKHTQYSAPPTGIYSETTTESISMTFKSSLSASEDGYNSTAEYEVDFPPVELKLPSVIREIPYNQSAAPSIRSSRSSAHSHSSYQSSYNSQQRFQSLGSMFTSIISFFQDNPNMTKVLFGVILCYVVVCNLEILIPKLFSMIIRLFYPWARYLAVICEQFFSTIANMFTRLDAVIYASYCEFAAKYCRSRRLMCDVSCSFVDHVLSQSRPQLAPIPQN